MISQKIACFWGYGSEMLKLDYIHQEYSCILLYKLQSSSPKLNTRLIRQTKWRTLFVPHINAHKDQIHKHRICNMCAYNSVEYIFSFLLQWKREEPTCRRPHQSMHLVVWNVIPHKGVCKCFQICGRSMKRTVIRHCTWTTKRIATGGS
jgi:hypothetical protein